MHEDGTEHEHYYSPTAEDRADLDVGELVRLTTVGIDVGSTTAHLTFSLLYLRRRGIDLASRYEVVLRELVHRSPIHLTPYLAEGTIDADALAGMVREAYESAGIRPREIDTGAVILTGQAAKSENSRAILARLADEGGRLVSASTGHHLEAMLAAHGSGAVALSRQLHGRVLNVDIGGGTTKFALVFDGVIQQVGAIAVGGRVIAEDDQGRVCRITETAQILSQRVGLPIQLGVRMEPSAKETMAEHLADSIFELIGQAGGNDHHREAGHDGGLSALTAELLLTPEVHAHEGSAAIVFSGGVAEYVYGREDRHFGDLGLALGSAIRRRIESGALPAPLEAAAEGIRATVLGAGQFTTQVSGNAVIVSDRRLLPLRNVPALLLQLPSGRRLVPGDVSRALGKAHQRLDLTEGAQPTVLALEGLDLQDCAAIAKGLVDGLHKTLTDGLPILLMSSGRILPLVDELRAQGVATQILAFEGVSVREFDFVDIGQVLQPSGRVPIVVKSLVFPATHSATHGHA